MALTVNPPPAGISAPTPLEVKPVDLQPALDRLHNAFREGFINAQDIQKRTEIGNTDAEAQRKQNEAAKAKAEQDRKDQEGGKGYTKPGMFSRLTGIGTGPKAPAPAAAPGAAVAPTPVITPPALGTPTAAAPQAAPPAGPFMQAAQADDFNPAHESTDDLLKLVGEGGYFLQ